MIEEFLAKITPEGIIFTLVIVVVITLLYKYVSSGNKIKKTKTKKTNIDKNIIEKIYKLNERTTEDLHNIYKLMVEKDNLIETERKIMLEEGNVSKETFQEYN